MSPWTLSVCWLLLPVAALAKTVTVQPGGLNAGIRQLSPGDTLLLASGTYRERPDSCTIPSGSGASPTILKAQAQRQAILAPGGGTTFRFDQATCGKHDLVFDGLTIDYEKRGFGEGYIVGDGSRDIIIQNGEVRNFLGTGSCSPSQAFGGGTPGLVIRNMYIHDIGTNDPPPNPSPCNFSYGIYLAGNGTTVENSVWANISAFAIHMYNGHGTPSNNTIRNNLFCRTGTVLIACGAGNVATGNRLYQVGQTAYPYEREPIKACQASQAQNNQILTSDPGCDRVTVAQPTDPTPDGPRVPRGLHLLRTR